ncbi:MAG TPA: hypothetical protein VGQ60_03090, partial [Nitrospiraceae bacterium]|nr:hypothetical protein [Nitrospiraceae bacterium]
MLDTVFTGADTHARLENIGPGEGGLRLDAAELYRFRAEELERNFQSLREIESRNVVEVFTGYAVLGIAYFQLQDRYPHNALLATGALLLTFSLFAIALYLTLRARERLHLLRRMQGLYVKKLHEVCSVP